MRIQISLPAAQLDLAQLSLTRGGPAAVAGLQVTFWSSFLSFSSPRKFVGCFWGDAVSGGVAKRVFLACVCVWQGHITHRQGSWECKNKINHTAHSCII